MLHIIGSKVTAVLPDRTKKVVLPRNKPLANQPTDTVHIGGVSRSAINGASPSIEKNI